MVRVELSPEAVHVHGGLRRRTIFFEDLAGVHGEGRRLRLMFRDRRAVSLSLSSAAVTDLTEVISAILADRPPVDSVPTLVAVVAEWMARPGFLAPPFVDFLLASAAAVGASDLHLQPDLVGGHRVSLRVDGVLAEVGTIDARRAGRVVGRLKVMAGVRMHRDDVPQEGRAVLGAGWVRLGFAPGVGGESVTIRLFDRLKGAACLHELGLPATVLSELRTLLLAPHGVVLFAGPSASGKTTTLYTALRTLLAEGEGTRRAVTVEDPVEYRLSGVVQLEPDPEAGLTGAALLRAALRQDADVLVVGEVRDPESVALLLRAGITGHLVLGTVHAANAAEVRLRLAELGAAEGLMSSAVLGILAQRLVRVGSTGAGYAGRTAVAELVTDRGALPDGGLRAHADALVAAGVTDAAEVDRVLGRNR